MTTLALWLASLAASHCGPTLFVDVVEGPAAVVIDVASGEAFQVRTADLPPFSGEGDLANRCGFHKALSDDDMDATRAKLGASDPGGPIKL